MKETGEADSVVRRSTKLSFPPPRANSYWNNYFNINLNLEVIKLIHDLVRVIGDWRFMSLLVLWASRVSANITYRAIIWTQKNHQQDGRHYRAYFTKYKSVWLAPRTVRSYYRGIHRTFVVMSSLRMKHGYSTRVLKLKNSSKKGCQLRVGTRKKETVSSAKIVLTSFSGWSSKITLVDHLDNGKTVTNVHLHRSLKGSRIDL